MNRIRKIKTFKLLSGCTYLFGTHGSKLLLKGLSTVIAFKYPKFRSLCKVSVDLGVDELHILGSSNSQELAC